MSVSSASLCGRCGAVLPHGAGASAGAICPLCGEPIDPDATWRPGPALMPRPAAVVDLPPRLPLALLALGAVACALMGLALGIWLSVGRSVPVRRVESALPPLPPPGPPVSRPMPAPQYYVPRAANTGLALPPARVTPPTAPTRWAYYPSSPRPAAPPLGRTGPTLGRLPVAQFPPRPVAPEAPLRADGLATVHVTNPSTTPIDVVLTGRGSQRGIVGPHAVVDFLIPPGRYDIALHGPSRIQRFYDAPVDRGDVLSLVYTERPPERAGEAPRTP